MPARRIRKLLVANRGEIALRIQRTCRLMGVSTVAVYSDPDRDTPFVRGADEAVALGGSTPRESYLRVEALIEAARRTRADAVHPGYGFLSENAGFARACQAADLTFVGPTPEAIEAMGSKLRARDIMARAGVPVLPGESTEGLTDEALVARAQEVGFPVLVKAAFGGGGRGMRVVDNPAGLLEAVASAKREAAAAFGNGTVFLEHYVSSPRHVELQIFGDTQGHAIHLFERECSIQRRHQKILEESPSPALDDKLRADMAQAAIKAAKAIGYMGAGTVEFIVSPTGKFFFLEVNTRLQVEHPVTELVTGLDLVRLQLLVAQGEPLPPELSTLRPSGHAIEARLYAEAPATGYSPTAGKLHTFDFPMQEGIRIDAGVVSGTVVGTEYDSMLAKVIAVAPTRREAVARLALALRRARLHGVGTNRELLVAILEHPEFEDGKFDTHFLQRHSPEALLTNPAAGAQRTLHALAAALSDQAHARAQAGVQSAAPSGFRNNPSQLQQRDYREGEMAIRVGYQLGREPRFVVDDREIAAIVHAQDTNGVDLTVDGIRRQVQVARVGTELFVDSALGASTFSSVDPFPSTESEVPSGSLLAAMPGRVLKVHVAPGARVEKGDVLVTLEAMKMEFSLKASGAGTVGVLRAGAGDNVSAGDVLVILEVEPVAPPTEAKS